MNTQDGANEKTTVDTEGRSHSRAVFTARPNSSLPNPADGNTAVPSAEEGQNAQHDWTRCFYNSPHNCGVCGYCRGWLADASPRNIHKKTCGHPSGYWCACEKYRPAPVGATA